MDREGVARETLGRGGSHDDPLFRLLTTVVGLPVLGMIGISAPRALDGLGWEAPDRFYLKFLALFAAAAAWLLFPLLAQVVKLARKTAIRSAALRDLSGPEYGWLGIFPIVRRRPDVHRLATEWAEKYGPIVRVRFLLFHVSSH